ncbi:MAG: hypothetical protein PVJ07_09190 [Anaerolineales bacterium]|jgi:hypothetical protein
MKVFPRNLKLLMQIGLVFLAMLACGLPNGVPEETPTVPPPPFPTATVTSRPTERPGPSPAPSATPEPEAVECPGVERAIALLVDPLLAEGIDPGLRQFRVDLCRDGYMALETRSAFSNPDQVRAHLAGLYAETEGQLAGAILIGDLPHAYQWVTLTSANPDIPSTGEEAISFQYYADLDGVFGRSPAYVSPGGHAYSYDLHTGNADWEIWIGVLPLHRGEYALSIEALNAYFMKNHAYRIGDYVIPRAFLQINEHFSASTMSEHNQILTAMRSGTYAWTPFSTEPTAMLFFDSPPGGLSVADGYANLPAGSADFTVGDAHGYWGGHGTLDVAWVESNSIRTVFFWSNGCSVGNLDFADNFLTSVVYSPTSLVLVAKGTTNNSGGMGTNSQGFFGHNIATAMAGGSSFGDAILSHVNVPLIHPWADSREFHFATVVIVGDPTLVLQP